MHKKIGLFIFSVCIALHFSSSVFAAEKTLVEGKQLFEARKMDEASKYFTNIIKQQPNNDGALFYLGQISSEKKEYEKAVRLFLKCIELKPDNSDYWSHLGITHLMLAEHADGLSAFSTLKTGRKALEKSLKLNPSNLMALSYLGKYYAAIPGFFGGDMDRARELASDLTKLDEIEGRLVSLIITVEDDEITEALEEYKVLAKKIGDDPKHSEFYLNYGYFLIEQALFDKAVIQFEKLRQLDPDEANSYDSLGDGYYADGRLDDARAAYKKALALEADFGDTKDKLNKIEKEIIKELKRKGK